MHWFWDPVIKPLLDAVGPKSIVQVGPSDPDSTPSLLGWALDHDAVVHLIEPAPELDLVELRGRHGAALIVHREHSQDALARIDRIDAALIDGEHNWYSVISELRLLAQKASAARRPFPLTLIHQVDWPYGRRDLYRQPGAVPAAYRQPYRRGGMLPGVAKPVAGRGLDRHLHSSVGEGEPRMGVRTAVEDFLSESRLKLSFDSVPGGHGLGILSNGTSSAASKRVGSVLRRFRSARFLAEQNARLELWRVRAAIEAIDLQLALDETDREVASLRKETELQDRLRYQLAGYEAQQASHEARETELEGVLEELRAKLRARPTHEPQPELGQKLAGLEAELAHRVGRIAELEKEREKLSAKLEVRQGLEQKVVALETKYEAKRERVAELEKEREKLSTKLEVRQGLEQKVVALETKYEAKRERVAELEKEREKLSTKLEVRQGLEYRLETLEAKLAAREGRVNELERERESLRAELDIRQALQDEVAVLDANLVSARERMSELMQERAALMQGRATLEAELESAREAEAAARSAEAAAKEAGASEAKALKKARKKAGKLRAELLAARADAARFEQLAEERDLTIGDYRSELRELREEIERVARSRSWRLGHRAMRGLKRLAFRPEYGSNSLERMAERLHALELRDSGQLGETPEDAVGGALARLEDASDQGAPKEAAQGDPDRTLVNLSEVGVGTSGYLQELAAARELADRRTAEKLEANLARSDAVLGTFSEELAPAWFDGSPPVPPGVGSKERQPTLMIGTLTTDENELVECRRSVGRQTYKPLDHLVIAGQAKKQAVATLLQRFRESDFDYMIKVDGDVVLLDPTFAERAVGILEANQHIDLLQMAILDYFSGAPMQGINAYRRSVEWRQERQNALFTDRSFVPKTKRLVTWAPFARSAIHSPNPSSFHAFHFGVHRGLKVLQPGQEKPDLPQAMEQTTYLERTWDHFLSRRDPRLGLACLGFERALAGEFELEHLDHDDPTLKAAAAELSGLDAPRLERLVRERRRHRVKAAPVEQLRKDRRRILWRSAATIRSIVVLLPHFGMYGGVNRFFRLAQALGDRGIECVLAKPDPQTLGYKKPLPETREDYPTVETRSYRDALARSWDVVLCGDCTSGVMLTMPMFEARISAVYLLNGWMRREPNVQQTRLVDPDVVIANSSYAARYYQDLAPIVVPGGVDLDTFRPGPPRPPSGGNGAGGNVATGADRLRLVAYSGRRKPIKGFEDLVAACTLLHERGVPIELNIYDEEPFELAAPFPWRHHGSLSPERLSALLREMDVMVSAERDAGWSNPTAEAMACGVPVVCTEAGTVDFAIDGETALVVPVTDPDAIVAAVSRLWEEPALGASLRTQGIERISGFGWPSVGAGLIEALDSARGDGARRRSLNGRAKQKLEALDRKLAETPAAALPG